ncbi:MAG: DUF2157 domain-containing protein [Blastocatellia bacterium]
MTPIKSSSFRAILKQEIPAWLQEGIVTEEAAQHLFARYELDKLKQESTGLVAAVIFTLGGLLLGGGLLSFVAANWEEIPTLAKVVLLLVTLLAFHGVGYWLWHYKGWPRLGHALVFTGSLVFGANIGLMAQIFHISGEWYGLFGAWALGALVMAYAARSWITGLLALMTALLWYGGISDAHPSAATALIPLVIAGAFLPLAWWLGSRVLYGATFVGLTIALCLAAAVKSNSSKHVLAAMVIGGLLSWAAGEFHRIKNIRPAFGNPIAGLGILTLGTCSYIWSFHDWWKLHNWIAGTANTSAGRVWAIPLVVAAVAAVALLTASVREINVAPARRLLAIGMMVATAMLFVSAMLGASQRGDATLLTIAVNFAALVIATVAIAIGVMDERRVAFWVGTLFLVLLIISRFLEYETSLLTKSAAFMLCGLAMITAGVAYEKYLARKEAHV